jgi:cytochrome b561
MLRTDEDPELLVFDPVIRFFHWLTLFLVATIFVLAFSIDFASSKEEAVALIQLHRSFGVTVWVVMLGRLVWRQFSRFPNWPADMPQATRFVGQWSDTRSTPSC